jgi:CAAX protease family protein
MDPTGVADPAATGQPLDASPRPPGWYPDPWRLAALRWWDGAHWSSYLLPAAQPPEAAPKGPGIRGGGIAGIGAGIGVIASLVVGVIEVLNYGSSTSPWLLLISELPLWAGFLGAAYLASKRNGTGKLSLDFGLTTPNLQDARLALPAALLGRVIPVIYLILVAIQLHLAHTPQGLAPTVLGVAPDGTAAWTVLLLLTLIGAPILEELFFRGLIQGVFSRRCGPVPALFITAIIFSFAHTLGEGPFAPFLLFPMAVILGYLKLKTGRLAAGMLAHAEYNAIGLAIVLIPWLN